MNQIEEHIFSKMPYGKEFLFLDEISYVDHEQIVGKYHFNNTHSFYQSHFKHFPVTPGVILVECMGQTGLVAHGIFLLGEKLKTQFIKPILIHTDSEFFKAVFPETTVRIVSNKLFFRNNHLRSKIIMYNDNNSEIIARTDSLIKFDLNE
ncbi:MAG: hydroxymyristoyl-ACP dehydratase [Bacteroidota bacterium]|nr:hydroxymyristoyl-ACP dehydratase [Bacteroidota bacterium]